MSVDLEKMKSMIDKMDKQQHIEILNIIKKNYSIETLKKNENKNGIYINMSCLPQDAIKEIQKFISYVNDQETSLNQIETEKKELMKTYHLEQKPKDLSRQKMI
jgi:hypothetical protein